MQRWAQDFLCINIYSHLNNPKVEIVAVSILQLRELSIKKLYNHFKVPKLISGGVGTQNEFI